MQVQLPSRRPTCWIGIDESPNREAQVDESSLDPDRQLRSYLCRPISIRAEYHARTVHRSYGDRIAQPRRVVEDRIEPACEVVAQILAGIVLRQQRYPPGGKLYFHRCPALVGA